MPMYRPMHRLKTSHSRYFCIQLATTTITPLHVQQEIFLLATSNLLQVPVPVPKVQVPV